MRRILLTFFVLVIFPLLVIAENDTNISDENQTGGIPIVENNTTIIDEENPSLIIISPIGNVSSTFPAIEISVNDNSNITCWYNITTSGNAGFEVVTFRQISDCKKEIMPQALQNNIGYIINFLVNDSFSNTNISSSTFVTPEIKIPEPSPSQPQNPISVKESGDSPTNISFVKNFILNINWDSEIKKPRNYIILSIISLIIFLLKKYL